LKLHMAPNRAQYRVTVGKLGATVLRQGRLPHMPSILRIGPYRFYFFSNEGEEPPHVHIDRDAASAKVWLGPLELARS